MYLSMDKKTVTKTAHRAHWSPCEMAALKAVPFFASLSTPAREQLLGTACRISLKSGEVLFQIGDKADRFFVVLEGWIKLYKTSPEGSETLIRIAGVSESFGEAAMFGGEGFPVSAEAFVSSRLLSFPESAFFKLLSSETDFSRSVLNGMSQRLRYLIGEVERNKGQSSCERLTHFLVQSCPQNQTSAAIKLPFSKGLLADSLGMTQPTLSRAFSRLHRAGLISISGKLIQIPNVPALRRYCLKT